MNLRIYLIDDEECIRDTFKWHLEALGHTVMTADRPASCKVFQGHLCTQTAPCADALIIDQHMPGMTGLEFIKQLSRRGCRGMANNILLMSGNTSAIDRRTVAELGCALVQKPLSLERLGLWMEGVEQRVAARAAAPL